MKPTDYRADRAGQIDVLSLDRSSQEPAEQELLEQELSELNAFLERVTDRSTIEVGKTSDLSVSQDSPELQLGQAYEAMGTLLSEAIPENAFRWKGPQEIVPKPYKPQKILYFTASRVHVIACALTVLFLVTGWAVWLQYESGNLFRGMDPSIIVGANNSPSVDELLAESDVSDDEEQEMSDWNQDIQDSYWGNSFEEQLDSIEFVMTNVQSNSDSLFKQAYWDGIDFLEMDDF